MKAKVAISGKEEDESQPSSPQNPQCHATTTQKYEEQKSWVTT